MTQDPPGWERHTSSRGGGALFLHNPTTGESRWFDGWVEKKSRWYGRKYWFQPTTGRAEWELPGKEFSQSPLAATSGGAIGGSGGGGNGAAAAPEVPKPSNDKVKSWMEKIKAAKAKAVATGGEQERHNTEAPGSYSGAGKRMHSRDRDPTVANLHIHKRRREEGDDGGTNDGDEAVSDDNMELDDDDDDDDDVQFPSAAAVAAAAAAAMPSEVLQPPLPPPPPREDVPSVAVRRERLRQDCLNRFAEENERYGAMSGVSKTSRCCRTEGMASGLSGMFGRFLWVQHMRQTLALASGEARRRSKAPPDPIFPSITDTDDKLVSELVEGNRSKVQAARVLGELAEACRESAAELEVFLEAELPNLAQHVVILEEEIPTAKGGFRMRPVTGKGARVPGPNPNASYSLKYVPSKYSGDVETSHAITGAHLHKTWQAYCARMHGVQPPPVWDSEFLRRLFCVLSRYETLSGSSDGYQMAFPASGFRLLRQLVSVDCECFASPLNCTLKRFCSVAYDTDKFFGSEGNFFLSNYQEGSFEANPPFVEEVMERMVDHMHHLLQYATGPMSFAIIVPGWNDAVSYTKMVASQFARPWPGFYLTLEKGRHNYRPGMQHRKDVEEKPSNCNTFLFFLQNDEGFGRWPVSGDSLDDLQRELESEARVHADRN